MSVIESNAIQSISDLDLPSMKTDLSENDEFEVVPDPNDDDEFTQAELEAQEAFVLIQQEQEAVKEELSKQHNLLLTACEKLESSKANHLQRVTELENKIASLELEVSNRDDSLKAKDEQIKANETLSEERDKLMATVCELKDTVQHKDGVIKQLREFTCDGFVDVQPHALQDAMLANELNQKGQKIEELRQRSHDLEHGLIKSAEENEKLRKENEELRHMTSALQEQVDQDRVDLREIRNTYEEQATILKQRIRGLVEELEQNQRSHNNSASPSTVQNGVVDQVNGHPPLVNTAMFPHLCGNCMLALSSESDLASHRIVCAAAQSNSHE